MEVRVLFFARSRELAGVSETSLSLESGATTTSLLQRLLHQVRCPRAAGGRLRLRPVACSLARAITLSPAA